MSKANSSADSKKTAVINNNTAHASDRPFGCKQCTRSFPTNAKLNAHVKDCHPVNPKDLLCEHCNGKFASIRSKNDHLQRCPQLKKQVWVPTTVVNTAKVGLRHVRDKNSLSESGIKIVELYREYLQDGSSSTFMLGRGKKNLEGASVTTYAYHLKDYLHFLEKSETEEFDYVLYFLNPLTIKDYLKHLQECRYAKKTMLNRLFALERFCGFVEEKLIELNNKQLTTLANNKRSHNKILEALNFISAQITTVSPLARQETKIRNSRESLEAADKWIGIASLFEKEAEMKTEIDGLIERMAKPNSK
jgi:hypothetical protein